MFKCTWQWVWLRLQIHLVQYWGQKHTVVSERKRETKSVAAPCLPCLPPSVLWCVSEGSAEGLWSLAKSVSGADGRSMGETEEGGRERCVVALIWSAVLVSTNQGLPAASVAEFTSPSPPAAHTGTNRNALAPCLHSHTPAHSQVWLSTCWTLQVSVSLPLHLTGSSHCEIGCKISKTELQVDLFPYSGWPTNHTLAKSSRSIVKGRVPTWTLKGHEL